MPTVKLTTGKIREMRRLHEEGVSVPEIAEIMGVSRSLVYARLKDETPAVPVRELDKSSLMTSSEMMARMQQRAEAKADPAQEAPKEEPKAEIPAPEPVREAPVQEVPKSEPVQPAMLISTVSYSGEFATYEVDDTMLVIRAGQDAALKLLKRDLPDFVRELEKLQTALGAIRGMMEGNDG